MCLALGRPSAPPNTPSIAIPDVSLQPELEELDHYDGIDFSRLRAELDRLLEEGLCEDGGTVDEASQETTPDQEARDQAPDHTTNVYNCHQDKNNSATTESLILTLE
ncbi:hypothetical protein V7S43_011917 [Phytophthora oleae]|uniref:Uncharacterized protein n=1 Tax=Phytophthora oleae TaxID=2107226 RepID=A0ABD3FD75_9STRA